MLNTKQNIANTEAPPHTECDYINYECAHCIVNGYRAPSHGIPTNNPIMSVFIGHL